MLAKSSGLLDMTFKKLKIHEDFAGQLVRLCQSEDFWRGFLNGMAPQRYLTVRYNYRHLLDDRDSLYEAWEDVGELLTDALTEYGHAEAPEVVEAEHGSRRRAASQFTHAN